MNLGRRISGYAFYFGLLFFTLTPLFAGEPGAPAIARTFRIDKSNGYTLKVIFDQYGWQTFSETDAYARQLEAAALMTFGSRIKSIRRMGVTVKGVKTRKFFPRLEVELPLDTAAATELNALFAHTWTGIKTLIFGFNFEKVRDGPVWSFEINPDRVGYYKEDNLKNPWQRVEQNRAQSLSILKLFFPALELPLPSLVLGVKNEREFKVFNLEFELSRADVSVNPILIVANYVRFLNEMPTASIHDECRLAIDSL